MKKRIILSIIAIGMFAIGCQTNTQKQTNKTELSAEALKGKKLMANNCYACHSPTAKQGARLAPPMIAIKRHYIDERNISEEQFIAEMKSFLNAPSKDKAIMTNAVNRFGVMPKMNYSNEQIELISKYIYNNEIEQPEWFEEHYQKERAKGNQSTALTDLQQGQKLAMQTKGVLGKNLMNALNTKGAQHALEFCSTKAIPLTDSMANELNASIKRVSDNNRNPNNKANTEELDYINHVKEKIATNKDYAPIMKTIGDKKVGYYPITTSKMCLQCHGNKKTDINVETLQAIAKKYPNDLATGYKENELRGIWVIEMPN